jgi:hypothetical protein
LIEFAKCKTVIAIKQLAIEKPCTHCFGTSLEIGISVGKELIEKTKGFQQAETEREKLGGNS